VRFHVCNSLTGSILGRLQVNQFEITEPVREQGATANFRVPISDVASERADLKALIRPVGSRASSRAIGVEDDGNILFYGPIIFTPTKDGPHVVINAVDWKAWFYTAPIRPTGATFATRRNYTATSTAQETIMTNLANLALRNATSGALLPGAPPITIDSPPASGINQSLTAKMFQGESIGGWLDNMQARDKAPEWYTYGALSSDEVTIISHFALAWPERRGTMEPHRLTWRQGEFGNTAGYSWPQRVIAPSRGWAVDGGEDTKIWSQATAPSVGVTDLLWETSTQMDDTKAKKADAFKKAKGELAKLTGVEGQINVTVTAETLPFSSYSVGDRVRLLVRDDWEEIDTRASRIIERKMAGAAGEPTQAVLKIDTFDDKYPDDGSNPGTAV